MVALEVRPSPPTPSSPPQHGSRYRADPRLMSVSILALLLLIPLFMARSVVCERYQAYQWVVADISGS